MLKNIPFSKKPPTKPKQKADCKTGNMLDTLLSPRGTGIVDFPWRMLRYHMGEDGRKILDRFYNQYSCS